MNWNLSDGRPIWVQLHEQLPLRIATGAYPMGSRMPTVRELAAEAGVNPNTMQRAMAQLEQDGLAVANRTAGRTVTEDAAVIQEARRARAMAAVAECLRVLADLGYAPEEAAEIIREGLNYE